MSFILDGLLACPCKTERRNHHQGEDGNLRGADQNRSLVTCHFLSSLTPHQRTGSRKRRGERGKSQPMCSSPSSKFLESLVSISLPGQGERGLRIKFETKSKEQHSVFKSTM